MLFQQNQFEGAIECFDKSMESLKRSNRNESNLKEKLNSEEKNFELAKLILNTPHDENEAQDMLEQMAQNSLREALESFEKEAHTASALASEILNVEANTTSTPVLVSA